MKIDLSRPLVSVVIPAYNADAYIAQTLASVVAQTYENLEIWVVDDGSCDRTVPIVQQFAQKDGRIRLLQQLNSGVAAARNRAIAAANGEFIAPIDADDVWYPDNIARQVQAMQRGGAKVGLVYAWSVDINVSGQPTGGFRATQISGNVHTTLIGHNFIGNASATLMRRSCLEQVGGYDPSLRSHDAQGCEDWDLYLRIAERYKFQVVPEFLIGYRKVDNSMSCDYRTMAKSHQQVMKAAQQRHPYLPWYLFKLSSSNLYMYFAHQSNRYQHHTTTRYWVRQALAAESLTPFIRPGFYRLLLSSTWGSLAQRHRFPEHCSGQDETSAISQDTLIPIETVSFQAPKLILSLMIWVGNAFHWIMTALAKENRALPAQVVNPAGLAKL